VDWLTGYFYRKQRSVDGSPTGAATDYTVGPLIVHKGYGIDSEGKVYLNGHCKDDFSDIRFTASDGITELPYWRDLYIDGEYAIFSVLFDSIPQSSTVNFYIYYDNPEAEYSGNIVDAFPLLGDDLEGETIGQDPSLWTVVQGTNTSTKISDDISNAKIRSENIAVNFGALCIAPDGRLWGGHFTDGTVRVSVDGGLTWTTKYTFTVGTGNVRCVFVAQNGYIYASRDQSQILVRSVDGGETWATCLTLSSAYSTVWVTGMTEETDGTLYCGEYSGGDSSPFTKCAYIYKSVNHGSSWTTIWNNPDDARHIHIVQVDPFTGKLYASQDSETAGGCKIIRSDDHGANWTVLGSGSALWMPTSVAFGSGFRLFGNEPVSGASKITKTVNDVDFTNAYIPPATDDNAYWMGGCRRSDGLIIFGSWTQTDNERATIVISWDDGVTWHIVEEMVTGVGNRGYYFFSGFDAYGNIYFTKSITTNCEKTYYQKRVDKSIEANSAGGTGTNCYRTVSFPTQFVIEHRSWPLQEDKVLVPLYLNQDTTVRINVVFWSDRLIKYHDGAGWVSTGIYYLKNRSYKFKYVVNLSTKKWTLYIDDVLIASDINFNNDGSTANNVRFYSGASAVGSTYIDEVRVREYIDPEPAWGAWGAVEHSPFLYLIGNLDLVYGRRGYLLGDINLSNATEWTRWRYLLGDIDLAYEKRQYLLGDFDLTPGGKAYLQGIITAVDRIIKPVAGSVFMRLNAVANQCVEI
jgi:photosystem II stability/assembly factor-like uncharacterized protein